jgi:hypothetical protein
MGNPVVKPFSIRISFASKARQRRGNPMTVKTSRLLDALSAVLCVIAGSAAKAGTTKPTFDCAGYS